MIRPATLADVPGLVAAIDAAYAPFRDAGLVLPPVSDGIDDHIRDNHVWVAEVDGIVMGGIIVVLGDQAQIANLAVHPKGAGRGIGQSLTDVAFDAAQAAGFDQMSLTTHQDMTATQAFYLRRGWIEIGRDGTKVYMSFELNQRNPA